MYLWCIICTNPLKCILSNNQSAKFNKNIRDFRRYYSNVFICCNKTMRFPSLSIKLTNDFNFAQRETFKKINVSL